MDFIIPDEQRRVFSQGDLLQVTREDIWFGAAACVAVIGGTIAAIQWPIAVPVIAGGVIVSVFLARAPHLLSPILLLLALPFIRPNVLSGEFATVGTFLIVAAAFVALATDRKKFRIPMSHALVTFGVSAMSLWALINASIFGSEAVPNILRGVMTTVLPVAAAGFVLADPARRRIVGKGFVWIVLALSASFAVTFGLWLVAGFGSFLLSSGVGFSASIYLPFTTSLGTQTVAGLTFPRFTGLGREPGWMSMYCGLALLLWSRVGKPNPLGIGILLVGLLGAFSTAGFGAFVVVIMIAWIMRKPKSGDAFTHYVGFLFKVSALAGAAWLAVYAPVFGFAAKGDLNESSLLDRSRATSAGLDALMNSPLGGVRTGTNESINLIASLAPFGVPFFLAVCAALFLPRFGHPNKALTVAPVLLIFITLLLSQPAGDSTWVFILVGLSYTLALPDSLALGQREGSPETKIHLGAPLPVRFTI